MVIGKIVCVGQIFRKSTMKATLSREKHGLAAANGGWTQRDTSSEKIRKKTYRSRITSWSADDHDGDHQYQNDQEPSFPPLGQDDICFRWTHMLSVHDGYKEMDVTPLYLRWQNRTDRLTAFAYWRPICPTSVERIFLTPMDSCHSNIIVPALRERWYLSLYT